MTRRTALSLFEIIVIVGILAIVALLAVPQAGRAAGPSPAEVELRNNLRILRVAIEQYHRDHGAYPGVTVDDPTPSVERLIAQLTQYSDRAGRTSPQGGTPFVFGPYLSRGIPPNPLVPRGVAGRPHPRNVIRLVGADSAAPDAPPAAWVYDPATGRIWASTGPPASTAPGGRNP